MTLNNVNTLINHLILLASLASVLSDVKGHTLEFIVEPIDTVVESGQSAVLDCVVKASYQPSVLIQWVDQDHQKLTFFGDLFRSQLTNGSLYINSVIEEQRLTGTYQCMATLPNVGSIISRTAALRISTIVGFHEEPRDITVSVGQKAYFACRVDANPIPKIRWLKDERPLQIDELRMTILPSGALIIDEVIDSDQGSYRCNASGINAYKLSNKAALIVLEDLEKINHLSPPTFISQPQSIQAIEGQNVSLDCAANGNPTPTIIWLKNGYAIDMNDLDSRFSLVGSTSSLRITNIKEEDTGTYQCRAENREDSLDASATIQVQVPPKFLIKPQDKIEAINKDVEFECSVYGIPEPEIHWYKNGELIILNEYYKIVNGYNLKIMGLMTTDAGLFQCFAINPAGNIQAVASLKIINPGSKFSNQNNKLSRKKNSKLDRIHSITLFSNLQSENSARLGDVDFGHLTSLNNKNYLQDSSTLSNYDPHRAFTSLKSSESNDNINLGDTQSAFFPAISKSFPADNSINIEGLPGPPQDFKAPVIKARFVVLSWKPPIFNNENIHTYSVYYQQEGSERERVLNSTRSKLEEINISGLTPGRVYNFRVVAINSFGIGTSSERLSITTQSEEHVASTPTNFTAYPTSPRTIHVNWGPPESPNGIIQRYRVFYMETLTATEHNFDTTDLMYDLSGLSVYTEYSIWVVAINKNGLGAATEEKIVRTFSSSPSEPPYNVTLEPSSTSLIVRWEPPPLENQNGPITGYKLRYRKEGKKGLTITTQANERYYILDNLERGSLYQIKLWAININGTSPSTDWYNIETYKNDLDESKVPDKPGPLRVRATTDKLYVMWTPPINQNIKVRHYILGWGKGVSDVYVQDLDEKTRNYIIEKLEPKSEYVISLRASNEMGAGPPVYTTVQTQNEPPIEIQSLIPPVGLKTQVYSPNSIFLYWTDTTINKNKYIKDNRYYVVKCVTEKSTKNRIVNVTETYATINDLKPNTPYEFSVKLVKGQNESPWSMVVQNTTFEPPPSAAPRDLDVHLKDESEIVELTWQPPKTTTGRITGYVILYTDNKTKSDREWLVQAIKGDKHFSVILDLKPFTEYYFKVQARNSRGYGPFSNIVMFRTGQNVGLNTINSGQHSGDKGIFSGTILLYLVICGCLVAVTTIAVVITVLCCRRKDSNTSPDRCKKGYQKTNQNVKQPPDLWIHHDQMELKAMEKSQSNHDGASSSGAMTLPRSIGGNDYDTHDTIHTNSLDKRTYITSYMGVVSSDDKNRKIGKPINLPVDSKPPREPIATPVNTTTVPLSQSSSDSTPSSRPSYPRTQYSMQRNLINESINNHSIENSFALNQNQWSNETHGTTQHLSTGTYAPGSIGVLTEKRLNSQSHPLKSFTVPAPPPVSAPGTPQPKHIVTVRPNSSPFKKINPTAMITSPPSRINPSNPPPHTIEEVQKLQPSHSTEELNQEMANLEGLMLTLNAITSNEFEC